MRSIISLLSIVFLLAVGCSTSEKAPAPSGKAGVISGQFSNVDAGTKIFLRSFSKGVLVESGVCELKEDGSFELVPNAPLKMGYHQIMISKRRPLVLITDESEPIYISANVPDGKGYLTGANISGSETTSLLATYYDELIPLQDSLMSVSSMLKQAEGEERGKYEGLTKKIIAALNDLSEGFVEANENSLAALAGLENLNPKTYFRDYETVLGNLREEYGKTEYFKSINKKYAMSQDPQNPPKKQTKQQQVQQKQRKGKNSKYMAGDMAPDIVMNDPDGNERKLSDLRGKVVLLDFWASWCGPCRRENPHVVHAYNKYKDRGFEVFSVSLDSDVNRWKAAIAQDGLVWDNHVSDLQSWRNAASQAYGITSIPHTMLLDKEGKIIRTHLRGSQLEQELIKQFGE